MYKNFCVFLFSCFIDTNRPKEVTPAMLEHYLEHLFGVKLKVCHKHDIGKEMDEKTVFEVSIH